MEIARIFHGASLKQASLESCMVFHLDTKDS